MQTDNENEPEGVEANNCTAGFDQEEVLDEEDVGLDGTIINTQLDGAVVGGAANLGKVDSKFIMKNGCCRECLKAFSKTGKVS